MVVDIFVWTEVVLLYFNCVIENQAHQICNSLHAMIAVLSWWRQKLSVINQFQFGMSK